MAENRKTNNINHFVVNGTVLKDAELKTVGQGFNILEFGIANNYLQKKGDEYEQEVNYFQCKVFGKRAEGLSKVLKKGTGVTCFGQIRQERWQSQDGKTQSRVTLNCDEVEITRWVNNGNNDNAQGGVAAQQKQFAQAQQSGSEFPEDLDFGTNIPF